MIKYFYNWSKLDPRYFCNGRVLGVISNHGLAYHYFVAEIEEMDASQLPPPIVAWDTHLRGAIEQLQLCRETEPVTEVKPVDIGRWRLISEETPDKPPPVGILGIELWWDDGTVIGVAYTLRWNTAAWYGHPEGGFKRRNTSISDALLEGSFTHWRYFVPPNYKAPTANA